MKISVTMLLGRCFHHSKIVRVCVKLLEVKATITIQEVIGKTLVNDDNGSGMDRETVCGV